MPTSFPFQKLGLNGMTLGSPVGIAKGGHIHESSSVPIIKDVWEDNFEEEFQTIMQVVDKYKVIAMVFPQLIIVNSI